MRVNRENRSITNRWWLSVDRYLLSAVLILMVIGGLMVITASPAVAHRIGAGQFHFIKLQFVYIMLAIGIMFFISLFEPITLRRICTIGFIGGIFLMLLTLFIGDEIKGSTRWISLGGFSLQPSEFLKPCFFVVSAWMFSEKLKNPAFPGFMVASVLYVMVVILLVLQPDIGTTIMFSAVWMGQFFLAGLPIILVAVFAGLGIVAAVMAYLIFPHVAARVDKFLHPESTDSYQITKSLDAFANGGFFGTGPGEGVIKKYIPDAHTDFIFAVLGEEMGLLFVLVVIGIFAFIAVRGFLKIHEYKDPFIILACAGILMNFCLQSVINMGVTLNLMPTKGMTLPFISYGGSSMLSSAISIGILLSLTRKRYETK